MNSVTKNNFYSQIPNNINQEIFESLIETSNIKIERIISNGQNTAENQWYDQKQNEWVILLKGNATLRFKYQKDIIALSEGDYINIPSHTLHRVESTSEDKETIWLAIHYD